MKDIIAGKKEFLKTNEISYVDVPMFDELRPENIIENLQLKNKQIWNRILNFCPELDQKDTPKDRAFFFNVLNTIEKRCMEKIVFNSV